LERKFLPFSLLRDFIKFPDPRLEELYREAQKEKFPVIEPEVGALIYLIVKTLKPQKVVEFGSGFGYSALWIALACPENCQIFCIDYQEKNRNRALKIFKQFGVEEKITYLTGDAEVVFNDLGFEKESLDLVLFDHEKQRYSESLDLVLPKLKKGGFIIADDVFWKREVFSEERSSIKAESLKFFLKELQLRREIDYFLCPLGDGVAVIRKREV